MSAVLEHYMQASEQLDTRLWLAADDHAAAGMLLRSPSVRRHARGRRRTAPLSAKAVRGTSIPGPRLPARQHAEAGRAAGRDAGHAAAPACLRKTLQETGLRVFEPMTPHFHCSCSRPKVAGMP
ncbi:Hsp33 family molecular chaperone HslO [Cupriavidus basilensis]